MKIDVPVFNQDGSVKFTSTLSEPEAQKLLEFAINFTIATGLAAHLGILGMGDDEKPSNFQ